MSQVVHFKGKCHGLVWFDLFLRNGEIRSSKTHFSSFNPIQPTIMMPLARGTNSVTVLLDWGDNL